MSGERASPQGSTDGSHKKNSGRDNIPDRILNSATGLLRGSLSPASSQPASTLASVLAGESKAGSSTSPAIAGPASSGDSHGSFKANQGINSLPDGKNGFRELHAANAIPTSGCSGSAGGLSLDQFIESAQDQRQVPTWQDNTTSKGKQRASDLNGYPTEPPVSDVDLSAIWDAIAHGQLSQSTSGNTEVVSQGTDGMIGAPYFDENDGADVLKLLQDPKASFWTDMPGEEEGEEEEADIPITISKEDMRIAENIVHLLGGVRAYKLGSETTISATVRGELFPRFSSFFDGIENYHDEVWGDLRPVVEEAKRESTLTGPWVAEGGPASRRLRMILAHVSGSR